MRKLLRSWIARVALSAFMLILLSGAAFGAANESASCIGIGSASEGQEGFRDDVAHEVIEFHEEFGATTPGGAYSFFAKLHEGSEEACFPEE